MSNNAIRNNTHNARRLSTETKASTKTTEFFIYLAAVAAIVITAYVVGDDSASGEGNDPFGPSQAIRYITFLTIGYMIARGLAKSGSRDNYDDNHN